MQVLQEIQRHGIQIYQFPEADEEEDDEEFIQINKELKEGIPFAVIGSNSVTEVNGRKVRGRIYPWGIVDSKFLGNFPLANFLWAPKSSNNELIQIL